MKVRLKQALQTGQAGKDTYRAMSRVQIRININDSKREQEQITVQRWAQQWNQNRDGETERGRRINKEFELL